MEFLKSDLEVIKSLVNFSIEKSTQRIKDWILQKFGSIKQFHLFGNVYQKKQIFKILTQLQQTNSKIDPNQFFKIIQFILSTLKRKFKIKKLEYQHDYEPYCRSKEFPNNFNQSEDDSNQSDEGQNQYHYAEKNQIGQKDFQKYKKTTEELKKMSKNKLINLLIVKYKVYIQKMLQENELTQNNNQSSEIIGIKELIKLLELCKKIILNDQFASFSLEIAEGEFVFQSQGVLDFNYTKYGFELCDIQEEHECVAEFPDHTAFFDLDVSQKNNVIKTIKIRLDGIIYYYSRMQTNSFPNIQINSPYSQIIVDYTENQKLKIDLSLIKIISCKNITFQIYKIENIINSFNNNLDIFNQDLKIEVSEATNFQNFYTLQNLIHEKTNKDPTKILDINIKDNFQNWIPSNHSFIQKIVTIEQKFNQIIKDSECIDQFFANKAFLIFKDQELNIGIQTILQILVFQRLQKIFNIQIAKLYYFLIDNDA
ncbi:hypothetical protein ABPG74_018425 [Tetrahymena malaccensis]